MPSINRIIAVSLFVVGFPALVWVLVFGGGWYMLHHLTAASYHPGLLVPALVIWGAAAKFLLDGSLSMVALGAAATGAPAVGYRIRRFQLLFPMSAARRSRLLVEVLMFGIQGRVLDDPVSVVMAVQPELLDEVDRVRFYTVAPATLRAVDALAEARRVVLDAAALRAESKAVDFVLTREEIELLLDEDRPAEAEAITETLRDDPSLSPRTRAGAWRYAAEAARRQGREADAEAAEAAARVLDPRGA